MHVAAGGRRFTWPFLLAVVAMPIIGADFLRHFIIIMIYLQLLIYRAYILYKKYIIVALVLGRVYLL